jgi:hypothetical protein
MLEVVGAGKVAFNAPAWLGWVTFRSRGQIMNLRRLSVAAAFMVLGACSSKSTSTATAPPSPTVLSPTPSGPTLTAIQVGVLGNADAAFEVGQSRQLWALGTNSDGTATDVTNTATWRTSNPVVATVSPAGVVSTGALGGAQITASVRDVVGSLGISVSTSCQLTLNPPRITYGPFERYGDVSVSAVPSDCRWTVSSDASWLPFTYDPGRSGNGSFSYEVPGNSTPSARSANLIVKTTSGVTAIHAIQQEKPQSCSYVVIPERSEFSRAGGTASFRVDATPDNCRWTASISSFYGSIVTGQSGTGDGSVTFSVNPSPYQQNGSVEIRGLSGQNPPGVHTFTLR